MPIGVYLSDIHQNEKSCYKEHDWIEKWLNSSSTKEAIGLDPSLDFQLVNISVFLAFHGRGDSVRNSAALLPELVNDGIRLLVYAGMTGTYFSNRVALVYY